MNIDDMKAMQTYVVQMRPLQKNFNPSCAFARISPESADRYLVRQGRSHCLATLVNPIENQTLSHYLSIFPARLAKISQLAEDGTFEIQFKFYYGKCREMGVINIGLSEEDIKKYGKFGNIDEYFCEQTMLFTDNDPEAYFVLEETLEANSAHDFTLSGRGIALQVKAGEYMGKKIFIAEKITRSYSQDGEKIMLAHGYIHFKDFSSASVIGDMASQQMRDIYKSGSAYLAAWDKYSALEEELMLERLRKIGVLEFANVQAESAFTASCRVYGGKLEELRPGDRLELTGKIPAYVGNSNMTTEEFHEERQAEAKEKGGIPDTFEVVEIDRSNGLLELRMENAVLPERGKFILNIAGDARQMERRQTAREKVLRGKSANPYLGLLIEDKAELPPMLKNRTRIEPMSAYIQNKIFDKGYTDNQFAAIDIALNTPDIALIQGPPGTGKTTVIRAIVERLNEVMDKKNSRGSILVSAFQHDAVNNVISRLRVNDLPQIKFGKKWNSGKEDEQSAVLRQWSADLAEKIRMKHPSLSENERARALGEAYEAYLQAPLEGNRKELLRTILALPPYILTSEDERNVQAMLVEMERKKRSRELNDRENILRAIYALRINENSYADDGFENAGLLASLLPWDCLDENDAAFLGSRPENYREGTQAFFARMRDLRDRLQVLFTPKSEYIIPHPDAAIMEVYARLRQKIQSVGVGGKESALLQFLKDLENCPMEVLRAVEDCNVVYAATVQQSEGYDIRMAKKANNAQEDDASFTYDTVIIDEAARVNPPDLLIPMARAVRRIILVGDQNQLPHLLDEEIAYRLETDAEMPANIGELLKESMFGHIFARLEKLSQADRIRRTVTLNTQYRMHPVFGDFVSRHFYDGKVGSGRPAEDFAHDLPDLNGSCYAWLDVPRSAGQEEKSGVSRIRSAEARMIVERLKKWLDCPQARKMTFGIISFYRAQAELITREAEKLGIFERQGGVLSLAEKYRDGAAERLRIGTVDAFQGMEFDVVFLSMTRSRDINDYIARHRNAQPFKIYGHLVSSNRLCVSLSRQKKVLVVAGDADMLRHDIARQGVPALADFLNMCEKGERFL